jgi:hypothetical protein
LISDNPISTDAMAAGILGTSIQKYVFDAAGNLTAVAGSAFVPFASTWDYAVPGDPTTLTIVDPGRTPGGLAWYNNGLLIGTDSGDIYFHDFTTNANTLFANTGDGGFVGGLEFGVPTTAPIPEPATVLLLGTLMTACGIALRRRRS